MLALLAYGLASLYVSMPLIFGVGMPGHVVDWALPSSNAGGKMFALQARYLWYPEGFGGLDYYSFLIRPLQFFASLPVNFGLSIVPVTKFWIWLTFTGSAFFAFLLGEDIAGNFRRQYPISRWITWGIAFLSGWFFAFNPLRFNFLLSGEFYSFQIVYMLYPLTLLFLKRGMTGQGRFSPHIAAFLLWVTIANLQLFAMLVAVGMVLGITVWRGGLSRKATLHMLSLLSLLCVGMILTFVTIAQSTPYWTRLQAPQTNLVIGNRPFVADWPLPFILAGYSYQRFTESLGGLSATWVTLSVACFLGVSALSVSINKKTSAVLLALILLFSTLASGLLAPYPLRILSSLVYSIPLLALAFQTPVYWMFPIPLVGVILFLQASCAVVVLVRRPHFSIRHPLRRYGFQVSAILIILLLMILWTQPLFAWRYTNYLDVTSNDPLMDSFQQKISADQDYYRVLYIPTESVVKFLPTPYQKGGSVGGDPVLMTSPKPGLDANLRVYPWSDLMTSRVVNAYQLEDGQTFEFLLQAAQVKYIVVNQGVQSLIGLNLTRVLGWLRSQSHLNLVDEDNYVSIFRFTELFQSYAFSTASPPELQTIGSSENMTAELSLHQQQRIDGWAAHSFGSGTLGTPKLTENSTWTLASSTTGLYSGFDLYRRYDRSINWKNYSGFVFNYYSNEPLVKVTIVVQGISNGTLWNSEYDLVTWNPSAASVVIPFMSFSNGESIILGNVTLVDVILSQPSPNLVFGLSNFGTFGFDAPAPVATSAFRSSSITERSPVDFVLRVEDASTPLFVLLPESFSPLWKAEILPTDSPVTVPIEEKYHFLGFGYANAWLVHQLGSYALHVTFVAQKVYEIGLVISLLLFILVGTLLVVGKKGIVRIGSSLRLKIAKGGLWALHRKKLAS